MVDYYGNEPHDKQLIESLTDPNITKKAYVEVIAIIDKKVDEIWRYILDISKRKLDWYAFQNDVSYGHGNGSSGGEFNPETDSEFIEFIGEFSHSSNEFYEYNYGFPTRFLWEDYQKEVKQHLLDIVVKSEQVKVVKPQKNSGLLLRKAKLKEKLASFLTPEELKMVKIK